ncbi:MAG: hypothetical protein J6Q05_04055 [Elusimicrobiaceae bacterium]|nr:hypothetical protein [Elusimicrobiaceae bacterium]
MTKWTFILLLSLFCPLTVAAQAVPKVTPKTNPQAALQTAVDRAVLQGSCQQSCANCQKMRSVNTPLTQQEIIAAEEELSYIRNYDLNATFEKYPYLLDPAYRRTHDTSGKMHLSDSVALSQEPLSTQEQIAAEEELASLRNHVDNHATFEKYPYLLDPAYRRAETETQKASIRRQYMQQTWARKVGL